MSEFMGVGDGIGQGKYSFINDKKNEIALQYKEQNNNFIIVLLIIYGLHSKWHSFYQMNIMCLGRREVETVTSPLCLSKRGDLLALELN